MYSVKPESSLQPKTTIFVYVPATCAPCKQEHNHNFLCFSFCLCFIPLKASGGKTDYAELLFPQRHLNPNTSWLPNVPLHPSISHPPSEEDIPPALPYRPNNLRNSAFPSANRLYPSLEEEFPHITIPLPATVMMMIFVDCLRCCLVLTLTLKIKDI